MDAPYAALLPLTPQAYRLQFGADMEAGRFAQAAAEYPRLNQAFPKPGPVLPPFLDANADANTLITSMLDGAAAGYALAATGQPAAARALLTDTETKLEAALTPAADKTGVAQPPSPIAGPLREAWRRARLLADARIAVADGRPTEALKALIGTELPVGAAGVELLTALQAALPASERALAPDSAVLAAKLTARREAEQLDVAALRRAMPLPETSGNIADYEGAGNRFLAGLFVAGGATDGFRSKTDAATGITTVAFVGKASSGPAVEELTLLRAADLARQAGKRGLLIVGRRDYAQTLTMTRMGIPLSSTPADYKTELDVRFVDPAALPADLAPERARVLDADQVYAALAPIYIARAGAKAGS
ncbi:hypothetical protein [uncultured Sphingomonas sp.]|uniref:hypothetical protein n=1 Tax=uncultured Sphingomonas sp. TaxID=158754 RepID=UPI0035C9C6C4